MRPIDADAACELCGAKEIGACSDECVLFMNSVPTLDLESLRPKGEWIDISRVMHSFDGDWFAEQYKCSLCGRKEYKKEPFCNCGADMRGIENE